MKKFDFEVRRTMHGDREYLAGDERQLSAADALPLVRAGSLVPKGKAAVEAMDALMGDDRLGYGVMRVGDEAMDRNNERAAAEGASPTPAKSTARRRSPPKPAAPIETKDAGDAPRNKADVAQPITGQVNAGEPGVEAVNPADLESADESGEDDGEAGAASSEDAATAAAVAGTEDVAASEPAKTAAPTKAKAAPTAKPRKRR